jgi:hypothetical protein
MLVICISLHFNADASSGRPVNDEQSNSTLPDDAKAKEIKNSIDQNDQLFLFKKDDLQSKVAFCHKQSEDLQKQIKKRGQSFKKKKALMNDLQKAKHCLCEIRRDGLKERINLMRLQIEELEKQYQETNCPLDHAREAEEIADTTAN